MRILVRLLCVFVLFCLTTCVNGAYDTGMAKNFVNYAGASYCYPQAINQWSCSFCRNSPLTDVTAFVNVQTNQKGFVGYNPSMNAIIVSFKGTDPTSIKNWITDLTFGAKNIDNWCKGCSVHTGFWDAYYSVRYDVIMNLLKYKSKYPKAKLWLTGHSLGGAIATLAAYDFQFGWIANVTGIYTFGAPRVGNPTFSAAWDALMYGKDAFRVVHWNDPVARVPLRLMNFKHSAREVWYGQFNLLYKVCKYPSEDDSCANSLLLNLLAIADHATYMGVDFAANFAICKLSPAEIASVEPSQLSSAEMQVFEDEKMFLTSQAQPQT